MKGRGSKGKWRHRIFAIVFIAGVCYALWSRWGRRSPTEATDLHLGETYSFGVDSGNGNLLGIEPYMVPADYASEERFREKLDGYLAVARQKELIGDKTVVVFPEYLGAWLVALGEKEGVYRARTLDAATRLLIASNLPSFLRWLPGANAPERAKCAVFKMKAAAMAGVYQRVFSDLARRYGVTIVAGSILLPNPQIIGGALEVGRGPLYNVSVVYGPDGRAYTPPVRKAVPTEYELQHIDAGPLEQLPVFETPLGRLGVLVCADAWYPQAYATLKAKRVDAIAVPAYVYPEGSWNELWSGYSGSAAPPDVDPGDVGRLRVGEAWENYALAGRLGESGAQVGISVFLRGELWDLGADGRACAVLTHTHHTCGRTDGGAVINLWLDAPHLGRSDSLRLSHSDGTPLDGF